MTDLLCATCSVLRRLRPEQFPRRPTLPRVCDGCRSRLTGDLAGLPEAYAAVYDHLEPGRTGAERRTIGYESRPPINISAWSLLLPGSDTPLAILQFWAQDWAGERTETIPDPTVVNTTFWLLNRLEWACNLHYAIDEFAMDLKSLVGQLRAFQPRPTGQSAGTCPRKPSDRRCGAQLFVDPYEDVIRCQRCGASWNRKEGEWTHLRAQQIAAGVEAA